MVRDRDYFNETVPRDVYDTKRKLVKYEATILAVTCGQRDGDSPTARIAAFSSSRNAAATEALRSKYQAREVSASAAACG